MVLYKHKITIGYNVLELANWLNESWTDSKTDKKKMLDGGVKFYISQSTLYCAVGN